MFYIGNNPFRCSSVFLNYFLTVLIKSCWAQKLNLRSANSHFAQTQTKKNVFNNLPGDLTWKCLKSCSHCLNPSEVGILIGKTVLKNFTLSSLQSVRLPRKLSLTKLENIHTNSSLHHPEEVGTVRSVLGQRICQLVGSPH